MNYIKIPFDRIQTPHLENLGGPEDTLDTVLVKVGDPLVHELEQYLEVLMVGALQDNDELAIESRIGE